MRRPAIAALAVAGALAGCGDDGGGGNGTSGGEQTSTLRNATPRSEVVTEEQVLRATGLRSIDNGLVYRTASGCDVALILLDRQSVDLYAGAGDTVVTNPDGYVGLKLTVEPKDERRCADELGRGLAKFR
jgi:hypothetical protein